MALQAVATTSTSSTSSVILGSAAAMAVVPCRGGSPAAAVLSMSRAGPARSRISLRSTRGAVRAFDSAAANLIAPAIQLTEKASSHLRKLRATNDSLCLRIGVKQGGCSGMSYIMDFEDQSKVRPDDSIIEAEDIKMVCDPKSLLFLFGMQLDYSDALIGGGFSFKNPNATSSCGCGKSFAA